MDITKRLLWLDNIRSSACILVVLLHVSAAYLYKFNAIPLSSWQIGNIIDSFTRMCVPLFFMISGYIFFRDKKPKPHNYLKLISAIIFYSFIYIFYMKFMSVYFSGGFVGWKTLVKMIPHTNVYYHLWFFYSLFIVYLFSNLITIRRDPSVLGLVVIFFIVVVWLNPIEFNSSRMKDILYYVMFAIFGAYIGSMDIKKSPFIKVILIAVITVSTFFIAYKTTRQTISAQTFTSSYYSYISIPVIFSAFCTFILLKTTNLPSKLQSISSFIARYSLGIYGIHALFLNFLTVANLRSYKYPLLDISITFLIVFILSILFSITIGMFDKKGYVS